MTKLSNLTKVTTAGDDALFYLVDPSRPVGDRSVGMDKDDVRELVGGGGSVELKTGSTMVFTENAFYNSSTYLTSGNITINGADAVEGATVWQHCAKYEPSIEVANDEEYRFIGGTASPTKLNIYKITYVDGRFDVGIDNISYLATSNPTYTVESETITISNFRVINAQNYVIRANTVDNKSTSTIIYQGDGTDLTEDYEYVYSGLTNGQEYFLWIDASGNGFEDADTATTSQTPDTSFTYRLYMGNVGGTITDVTTLATYFEEDNGAPLDGGTALTASDIASFSVDANNNIFADILVQYRCAPSAFNVNTSLTYFIDLDGGLVSTNQTAFQACTTMRYWYSPTALIRGTSSTSRVFRNIQTPFELLYIAADPIIGTSATTNSQDLDLLTTGIEIFANAAAETNNAGGIEADIANAISQKSAVVTFVANSNLPSAVSDLTVTPSSTSAVLNFTAPSSSNPIAKYSVWLDGAWFGFITASGQSITGLTASTSYNVKLMTADNQHNLSDFGNEVTFSTTA